MQNKPMIVHLLSGGLDSVTMLYEMHGDGCSVHCLLFDYRQPHVQELQWAKHHCHRLGVNYTTIDLPRLGGLTDGDWVVPFRNPVMLSIAVNIAVQAGADTVTIGCNKDDREQFPDCRWEVIDSLNHTITLCGYSVAIKTPYEGMRKWQIIAKAKALGINLYEMWSCYRGGAKPCMKCPACLKMLDATKDEMGMRESRPL